jgi:acetate kinase
VLYYSDKTLKIKNNKKMIVLVLNCGSSSIKYQVIDIDEQSNALLAKGLVDRIGLPEGSLTHKPTGKNKYEVVKPIADHTTGISMVLEALTDPTHGVIADLNEVKAVGHRVAHGGEFFKSSVVVDEQAKQNIRSLFEIAPLHNPANLEGVLSIEKVLPGIPQVAVFDTSFHQTIPAINYLYALPEEYYEKYRVRKYGFHGTSHKYVAKIGAELCGLDLENSKIVTCHVGNGGSVTAVLNGKSFDTSMGFSPLDGLVMGTRCGSVDASAITYIGENEGMSYAELNAMMNKKSGVMGMTGLSSDMRDIDAAYDAGNEKAIVARDMYYNRVKKFVGEYAAEMGGVDLVIFTGGVGENSADLRRYVCHNMEFMGIELNDAVNDVTRGVNTIISTPESKVKVAVIATNEELVIATDTYNLTKNL